MEVISPPRSNVRFFFYFVTRTSNSRHIRIFCDSIWNILHNAFVSEHRLLMLTEYISSLLLVTLILKHVWYQRTCSNQYVVDGVWYLRPVEVLSISAANCVRLLTCYDVWTSDFIHLAFPDPHTSAIKEIRFETMSFSFEKITFYVAMNVFLGAGDRSGSSCPFIESEVDFCSFAFCML